MLNRGQNISDYIQSNECLLGIRILLSICNSEISNCKNGKVNKSENQNIKSIINILDRKRRELERKSRNSLSRLKTRVLFGGADSIDGINDTNCAFEESTGEEVFFPDECKFPNFNGKSDTFAENDSGSLSIRDEIGSWDNPIPNVQGVPCDYYERMILEKYLEYWKNSKLSVPFSDWGVDIHEYKAITNFVSPGIIDDEKGGNKGCKSIQEAVYKLRKLEQDFQCIPKQIIIQILKGDCSLHSDGSKDELREFNRARLLCGRGNSFNVPQSLFLGMVINEHQNNSSLETCVKSTSLIKSSVLKAKDCDLVDIADDKSASSLLSQCNCDFYKTKQKFMDKYDLHSLSSSTGTAKRNGPDGKSNESNLRLWMGAYCLPRNDKRSSGGEDGWFVAENVQSMGVADGVGEWEDLSGKSAQHFSNNLMLNSLNYIKNNVNVINYENPSTLAKKSLIEGLNTCVESGIHGASTALVLCFNHVQGTVGFANIGDSGALVLRRLQFDTGKMEIVRRVKEMQHGFNCPYQLATLPGEKEWPELIEKGYTDIVELASIEKDRRSNRESEDLNKRNGQTFVCDDPELSQLLDVKVKEGDLIVIGTDGLFDNLFDFEITSIVGLSHSPAESKLFYNNLDNATSPMLISKAIALSAYHKSLDPYTKTPFANHAKKFYSSDKNSLFCNQTFSGGKEDDITVLVAWVVNKDDFKILTRNSPNICDIKKKL